MQGHGLTWVDGPEGPYCRITKTRRAILRAGGLNGVLFAAACVGVVAGGWGWELVHAWWGATLGATAGTGYVLVLYTRIITGLRVSHERICIEGPIGERQLTVGGVRRVALRRTAAWLTVHMTIWERSGRRTSGVMYFFWPPEAEVRGLCDRVRGILEESGVEVEVR
jgi:hypothetical protein